MLKKVKPIHALLGILTGVILASCQTTTETGATPKAPQAAQECTTRNDAEFARLSARLVGMMSHLTDIGDGPPSSLRISKCGWIEGRESDGTVNRANLSALFGEINFIHGKPVYLRATPFTRRNPGSSTPRQWTFDLGIATFNTSSLAESKRVVDRVNSIITQMSQLATGTRTQTRSGAAQAASVQRTQGRVAAAGAMLGQIARAGAQATSQSSGAGGQSFQCTIRCLGRGSAQGEVKMSVQAATAYDADRSLQNRGLDQICRSAGYSTVDSYLFIDDGITCR